MKNSPFTGIQAHTRAFQLLQSNQEIRRRAYVPFFINFVLFLIAVPLGIWGALRLVDTLLGDGSGVIAVAVKIIAVIAVGIFSILLFTVIGSIIAGPFSGPLSEAVERYELQRRSLPFHSITPERGIVTDAWRGIIYAVGRLFLFLLIYPFIFLTQFIPVIGVVLHPVLVFLYAAFVLSVDFSDPILDRKVDSFREKLRYVWGRKASYIGFGAGAFLLMFIPILNLFVIPVCVTAATLLYVELNSSSTDR